MAKKIFTESNIEIRKTSELLPQIFQTDANDKFFGATLDPLVQPGVLQKIVGYLGRRYGKTYNGNDIYLDNDETLRSRYQLEPNIVVSENSKITSVYDYIDFKNQLKFFGNDNERDDLTIGTEVYSWDPPIDWDKFVNFREYYWVPEGPPLVEVKGQQQGIESTYRVKLGSVDDYIFYPDGLSSNPTITLYRGQTYNFIINTPNNNFFIRRNYDIGNLLYNPQQSYQKNTLVLFDNKLWRANKFISASDGSTIDSDSEDWDYIEPATEESNEIIYNEGVTNNGTSNGTLTFSVPLDAPDVLYYQSQTNSNIIGRFIIADIDTNTFLDIEKDIIGKFYYTSSNGINFTNGLIVKFSGQVSPIKYATDDKWIVEGVGESIVLVKWADLVIPKNINDDIPEILFDNAGFDDEPFDDATFYPGKKDYVTINKGSQDLNPWSRYNRWFHRSVLEYAHQQSNSNFPSDETLRAKRPIIEFQANLKLFNHGTKAKQSVDYIDTFTTDVFSLIEGSAGYIVDGESLFEGARLLVVADTDKLVNNKIYEVIFVTHNGNRQIHLKEDIDSDPVEGDSILVKRGKINQRLMFHYDGNKWIFSQEKTSVNQPPKFDVFDGDEISFSDNTKYPSTDFSGTEIVSYKIGNSIVDPELGIKLSYLNIDNVGDIQFEFDWEKDFFTYTLDKEFKNIDLRTGFVFDSSRNEYRNFWIKNDSKYLYPIIDSVVIEQAGFTFNSTAVEWKDMSQSGEIYLYINNERYNGNYQRIQNQFTIEQQLNEKDIVVLKIFDTVVPKTGYYEFPSGIEKNPLNENLENFTYGTATDHLISSLEFYPSLQGVVPGVSNLRDITGYRSSAKRIVKHLGINVIAALLLCDKKINLIKSIDYVKREYIEFKNKFLDLSTKLEPEADIPEFVDKILNQISKNKNNNSSFANSDMVGSGAFTTVSYTVKDTGIDTFALTNKFDLDTLSRKAVYVYHNGEHLIHGKDYEFNSTFGFLKIKFPLQENDSILIKEYLSTSYSFIPPTPTKLGLYKKYLPTIFEDDTYQNIQKVIQGHDGSITLAYDDYRDDLLLELEKRIYNNIKQQYDQNLFDIDLHLSGFYDTGIFSKTLVDRIISKDYLSWLSDSDIDYINNNFFDSENSFTYTYSNMTDVNETANLPGYWRGVYKHFYDTDRPHRCPWEMLGFSEKPTWWDDEYGPAPYTKNNLLLWEDLRDGIIRQGLRQGTYDRYKRSTLLDHIPVDGNGNLISPLESRLAYNFSLIDSKNNFVIGDVSPVEYAWRSSSEYPFSIIKALCLLKPFDYIAKNFSNSSVEKNKLEQLTSKISGYFVTVNDYILSESVDSLPAGLSVFLVNYLRAQTVDTEVLNNSIQNINVFLGSRLSGFVDKNNQKFILDSKNPKSTSGSIFIPQENYDILFKVSSPISSLSYSGVIIEKQNQGWKITGYDKLNAVFKYYEAIPLANDPVINVGGVSENFLEWNGEKFYGNGVIVRYQGEFYRSLRSHTSETFFDTTLWKKLPSIPVVGGSQALYRRNFNNRQESTLSYGVVLGTTQQVVDFLLGYENWLIAQGFVFEDFNTSNLTANNWLTSVKEFMYWSKQNWAEGSIITLSPIANRIQISIPIGVADNFLDPFYDYNILKSDGTILRSNFIDVKRDFQNIVISTTNQDDGIYFININFVLKEHVVMFNDRTVFNDVIYDKPTGYRQERIKARGFRTTDWDGDYTSPGFLFDNVNIEVWQPFVDYRLGDIVAYKSFNWVSIVNQSGSETFIDENWSLLDTEPEKRLIPNYDYRINQFEDYFDLDADAVGESQRQLGRHSIGYQSRSYLEALSEDEVTQFKIYQGFIKEKGTNNAIVKVFDKTSRVDDDSVVLKEEWAFLIGRYGGYDQLTEIEFNVPKFKFKINPQPLLITNSQTSGAVVDQYMRLSPVDFTLSKNPFTSNLNKTSYYDGINRGAGFVNLEDIDLIIKSKESLKDVDIFSLEENSHIWVTFDIANSWTVLRYNKSDQLIVTNISRLDDRVTVFFNRAHSYTVDEYVGFKDILNLEGFYKIVAVSTTSIIIEIDEDADDPEFDFSSFVYIYELQVCKFLNYDQLDKERTALLKNGSKLWIEKNGENLWEVVEKVKTYEVKEIVNYGFVNPVNVGYAVSYIENLKQTVVGIPKSNYVMIYKESGNTLSLNQIVAPPDNLIASLGFSFGESIAVSPDGRILAIGAPRASGIVSKFKGEFDPTAAYQIEDIVKDPVTGKLYEAIEDTVFDGSTLDLQSGRWKPATIILENETGNGEGSFQQGLVLLYYWNGSQWIYFESLLSQSPDSEEQFGSKISIGMTGSTYYLAASAPGSFDRRGRVYLYKRINNVWSFLANENYYGIFRPNNFYLEGSIVYYQSKFYEALTEIKEGTYEINTTEDSSGYWQEIENIAVSGALPQNIFYTGDSSITAFENAEQITGEDSTNEGLIKEGDHFGFNIAMSRDASILAVSAPYSDGRFFENYRGDYQELIEYASDDVVRYRSFYYKLTDPRMQDDNWDSTQKYYATGIEPTDSIDSPWMKVGSLDPVSKGKIFIYQRDQYDRYLLKQTITADTLSEIDDTMNGIVEAGDFFGYAMDIDAAGTTLIVSSPADTIDLDKKGSVSVLRNSTLTGIQFRLTQTLQSFENAGNEFFGSSVSISKNTSHIVAGASNARFEVITKFNTYSLYVRTTDIRHTYEPSDFTPAQSSTTFDNGITNFKEIEGLAGQAYVFQLKDDNYFLAEKLEANVKEFESFGFSIDNTSDVIVVGSPNYKDENGDTVGIVRLFRKDSNIDPLNLIRLENQLTEIEEIESAFLFDNFNKVKVSDIEFVDHYKNKFLGTVEQEIDYKTMYDPAIYSIGTDDQTVDTALPWREKHVGKVWWNLSTVKWINYEQDDIAYRIGNWNRLAEGSAVDVYEWVESTLLPSEWALVADTVEGLSVGISGQPLYPDDSVYSIKEIFNVATGSLTETLYYFWVKNKTVIPNNTTRKLSVSNVASLISNPAGSGLPIISLIDQDKFLLYNFENYITNDQFYINVRYKNDFKNLIPVHKEYQLLTENQADSLPCEYLERKWLDSLIGFDNQGNRVPNPRLPENQKYGIFFRPRQGMFKNKELILRITIDRINNILQKLLLVDSINFEKLNSFDPIPNISLNNYDLVVDTNIDLEQVGTARLRTAILEANIVDGRLDSVNIIDTGFGYRRPPSVVISGDGQGASIAVSIDSQGRVSSVSVTTQGKNYTSILFTVRPFAVLVTSDENVNGFWAINSYDPQRKLFFRSKSQSFKTSFYWEYIDWWKDGYSPENRISLEIPSLYVSESLDLEIGELFKVQEYGSGGWAVFEKVNNLRDFSGAYDLVGRQNGTIRLKDSLYNIRTTPIGFDNIGNFDTELYDLQPIKELRNILQSVKEDIFVNEYKVEWNKLFFVAINYVFSEQDYVDWAFKTSFLNAIHNVGPLEQRISYKNDNLDSYRSYIEEIKPYRTTIREFTSRYNNFDRSYSDVTDFDIPSYYSSVSGNIEPVGINSNLIQEYPWKNWFDNYKFEIGAIDITYAGSGYINAPYVRIEGDGSGASAVAYVSNGRVTSIRVLEPGSGYTFAPTVTLIGGNGNSLDIAKASAKISNSKIRSFQLGLKFDRIAKLGSYENFVFDQNITISSITSVIELNYPPTRDKSKISISVNNQKVLSNEYDISFYFVEREYRIPKAKVIFSFRLEIGDVVDINYEISDDLLDSINRIQKYYAPTSGMIGKEVNQLMTGIDFGGVIIQGTTFDVTGGWDALPWFTEGWDSVESNGDFYVVADGSTTSVVLPYVPTPGQIISIYLKRAYTNPYVGFSRDSTFDRRIDNLQYGEIPKDTKIIRIDDPYYDLYDGITVQPNGRTTAPENAVMPSFIGDGSSNTVEFVNSDTDIKYLTTNPGDILIFRTVNSDGSLAINDVNLLDTKIEGGSLENNTNNTQIAKNTIDGAYITAQGLAAEDITVDGGKFISPDKVPSPEENIPGQILDALSIKVFNVKRTGAAPLSTKIYKSDGITKIYTIGLNSVVDSSSVLVYVDKVKKEIDDYDIDFNNNRIIFKEAIAIDSIIEIVAIGYGGIELLDYQEFVADGETNLFLTKAQFLSTTSVYVTVDGVKVDVGFVDSSELIDEAGFTLVQFGNAVERNKVVKIICLGISDVYDSSVVNLIKLNSQSYIADDSTRSFDILGFTDFARGSANSSVGISINGVFLQGVDTTFVVYDGANNSIEIGKDLFEFPSSIPYTNIKVYVNNILKEFVLDYTYNGVENLIVVRADILNIGDEIRIENDFRSRYTVVGNTLTIDSAVEINSGDNIEILWFDEYPTANIISDEYEGGKSMYQLPIKPLDISYVWVYKNGVRLTQDIDFAIDVERGIIRLKDQTSTIDKIKIVIFGQDIYTKPSAFEIFKDVLNVYQYKRYSVANEIKLVSDLNYYDKTITVSDASSLPEPDIQRNIPGVIAVNNEKIEYFSKTGNVLGRLRRGANGTSIPEIHLADSYVVNSGKTEVIPYVEDQEKIDFISDGSSSMIGPLNFVPRKNTNANFYRIQEVQNNVVVYPSIPENFAQCDEIEVFVGGKRLRKNSTSIYDKNLGISSPEADVQIEAEFSVDGNTEFVRLSVVPPAGTLISIIRRTGKFWYERGESTISAGKAFFDNSTTIINFIKEKSSETPE